jgi:hypothetical protein
VVRATNREVSRRPLTQPSGRDTITSIAETLKEGAIIVWAGEIALWKVEPAD